MTYSCTDFTDSILDALGIDVPDDSLDSPSDQADLALAEIKRLQRLDLDDVEKGVIESALRMIQDMGLQGDIDIEQLCAKINFTGAGK